jgi:predicted RNA binding protein YcfA (HicA-like mRNA interferase family)
LGKLRVLAGREACKILEEHGFVAVRQRGSHRIMPLQTEGTTITIPVPLHDPLRRGTLQSIIRQSGLAKSLFESR